MKFSIGIPAFKATYLEDCINSILSQSYKDFEIVIVNDASPENIYDIVQKFKSKNITYYENEKNIGATNVVDNWNKCLALSKGEYFVLMGDDDKLAPNYLKEFNELIENYPLCDVFHCRTKIIDEIGRPIALTEPRPEFETVYDSIFQRMQNNRVFFISDYVYRTLTLKNNGGFYKLPLAWASDDISAYIATASNGIAHTNSPLFVYRMNAQTISSLGSTHLKLDAILKEKKWLEDFIKIEATNEFAEIVRKNIISDLNRFIQKKKIITLSMETSVNAFQLFFKWFPFRNKYKISSLELIYSAVMKMKKKYKN